MTDMQIHVATAFHAKPFGRDASHDPDANGAKFRDEHLVPALREGQPVVVDFSGTGAVAPSFIDEAFGGLIGCGFSFDDLTRLLTIRFPNNPSREVLAWDRIRVAAGLSTLVH